MRRSLLAWFGREGRDLPWRRRRDPWRVWVSETMLQQTRVEVVVGRYAAFLSRFPSMASLARADEADVLAAWSGLGYYRRARRLHAGARFVVRECGGRLPRTREELLRVPGIGAYTAAAIASIAFGRREAAVDANVARVVSRVWGIAAADKASLAARAAALVDCERPGDVNEALMDLGAAVCTARVARCGACPLSRSCAAASAPVPTALGATPPRPPARAVALACAVVRRGDRVLFARRPDGDALLGGMWDFPTLEVERGEDAGPALARLVRDLVGEDATLRGPALAVRHEIVGRRITASVWEGALERAPRGLARDVRMLDAGELEAVAVPALPLKILRALAPSSARRTREARAEA